MERLTTRWCPYGYDTFDPIDIVDNEYSKANYEKILQRLGEYEDAEEQGLLLRLPCAIGTTVYDIKWWDEKSESVLVEGKKYFRRIQKHKVSKSKFSLFDIDCFGKEVFLTREEAESALERMKGEQHDL